MIGLVAGDDGGWSCSEGGRARVASDGRAADSRAKPANSNRLRRVRARALRAGSWLLWLGTILWFSWRAGRVRKKRRFAARPESASAAYKRYFRKKSKNTKKIKFFLR